MNARSLSARTVLTDLATFGALLLCAATWVLAYVGVCPPVLA